MKRSIRGVVAVLAGMAMAIPGAGIANAAPTPLTPIASDTTQHASTQKVRVMVVLKDQPTGASTAQESEYLAAQDAKLGDWSKRYGLQVRRQFGYLVNAFSAEMPENRIAALAAQPGVRSVTKARTYTPADESSDELTQTAAARAATGGPDGTGTVVAVIDTGIDASHQDMRLSAAGEAGAKIKNVKPGGQFTLKVPYGHNFADENDQVKDLTSSQHGMHVSGIVAANGGADADIATNGRVNGAAPEAQLLAMKVFSNDVAKSGSAHDDDIVAAIEDSVKHKADIINMSLGSPNGFSGSDFGIQKAINTATAQGVLVVVAAGNEGLLSSLSGDTTDYYGTLDNATVGSPSTTSGALSVAAVEGKSVVESKAESYIGASTTPEFTFAYSHQAGDYVTTPTAIADGGLGKPDQLTGVKGKIALIKRGEINFSDKIANALAAGATGVVVWNHEAGGEAFVSMAGTDGVTDPVAFIGNSAGTRLHDELAAGEDVRITLTNGNVVTANDAALTPSSFTSWGPTPSLDFKPELAGIGGNVYSTLNDNTYGTMSGTSMATPNVAGISALLLQKLREKSPSASAQDEIAHMRTAMVNTAKILTDPDGVPYAPRQVGAGLVQTVDAIDTDVTATVQGSATVALKEITSARTLTVTLKNSGTVARTFTTGSTVINESEGSDGVIGTIRATDEAATASATTVTVPAGGSATVDFTVTPNAGRADHYIEGWLRLTSADATQPSLSLPFLGFVGDWNGEPIVDPPASTGKSLFEALFETDAHSTTLRTVSGDDTGTAAGATWISPNGDRVQDSVYPALALLRGATHIDYQILDASGKVVAQPGQSNEVAPDLLSDIYSGKASGQHEATEAIFDGSTWNAKEGGDTLLPDGRYTYRISATLADGYRAQATDLPFGIDTVAPTIALRSTDRSGDDVVLTYSFTDDASGWGSATAEVGFDGQSATVSGGANGTFTVTVPGAAKDPAAAHHVVVTARDAAGNAATDTHFFAQGLLVNGLAALTSGPINDQSTDANGHVLVKAGVVTLSVTATDGIASVSANGTTPVGVDPATHTASLPLPLTANAVNTVTLTGLDSSGKTVATEAPFTITYDTVAPELSLSSPTVGTDGLVHASDGKVTVAGTVSDNLSKSPVVTVNGKDVTVTDGAFSVDLSDLTSRVLSLTASDGVNVTQQVLVLSSESVSGSPLIDTMSVDPSNSVILGLNAHSAGVSGASAGTPVLTITGRLNRQPRNFTIAGRTVRVATDGTFSFELPLVSGLNDTNFTLVDSDGTPVLDTTLKIYYDQTAPEVSLDSPKLHPGTDGVPTLFTNSSPVTLAGTVQDDTTGYTLSVNSDVVKDFSSLSDLGAATKQAWSWTGEVADGDTLRLRVVDQMNNGLDQRIPVVIDTRKPGLVLTGVATGDVVTKGADTPVAISASDAHLDSLEVSVDGTPVDVTRGEDGTLHAAVAAGHLASGTHVITALATDYAGNATATSVTFVVNAAPVITGPDTVSVNPDDSGWKDTLLAHWKVDDDQADTVITADLSRLVPGDNELVLTATDSYGLTTTRTVHVVLERPVSALTSGCVSMQASFVKGDSLRATCSTSGNRTTVTVANAGATISGRLTVRTGEVMKVLRKSGSTWVPVIFEKVTGGVSFLGSSDATYMLVGPDHPGTTDNAGGTGSGSGSAGTGTGGGSSITPLHPGGLSHTGSNAEGIVLLGGFLAAAGALAFAVAKRRRGSDS